MKTTEIIKRVKRIEIKTRGLTHQIFSGQYHSAFKGRGMAFSEVRSYVPGDDVRAIDWNVTARFSQPYVKIFEEERELTVMLLIDVSGSNNFGTNVLLKESLITELSAVLSFSAITNNDKVGVIFFSDQIEKFIPPLKGTKHILRIIRELIDFKPKSNKTDITEALKYLTNAIKKRCTAFVISDFIAPDFSEALKIANKKHDVIAIRIRDKNELELPNIGMIKFYDAESKQKKWINTANHKIREQFRKARIAHDQNIKNSFLKSGVDNISVFTGDDYVKPLINLFKRREARF